MFGLKRKPKPRDRFPEDIEQALLATEGLPFARRGLLRRLAAIAAKLSHNNYGQYLRELLEREAWP